MSKNNKFEVFATVDPAEYTGSAPLEDYIRSGMVMELAYEVAQTFPSEVSRQTVCQIKGTALEEHKMTLFIFSEQQMEEHNKEIRRNILMSMAAAKAMAKMKGEVCH